MEQVGHLRKHIGHPKQSREGKKHQILGGALFTYTHLAFLKFQMEFYFCRNEFFNYLGLIWFFTFSLSLHFNVQSERATETGARTGEYVSYNSQNAEISKQKNNKIAASFLYWFLWRVKLEIAEENVLEAIMSEIIKHQNERTVHLFFDGKFMLMLVIIENISLN